MSRRRVFEGLQQPPETCHAGLWLDRFLGANVDADKAKTILVKQVAGIKEPGAYAHFYKHWLRSLQQGGASTRVASVQGRMIVGLGAESVLETAVCLHHTYGVPYIPGSAIKGMTAAYARQRLNGWQAANPASPASPQDAPLSNYALVFGTPASAGYVTFFDALYIPRSAEQALVVDVMTPHHSQYSVKQAPTDFDSPVPVQFLSATGSYLLALGGDASWVQYTFELIALALRDYGIGAKTTSGYGRMELEAPPLDPDQEVVDLLLDDIKRLKPQDVATRLDPLYQRWQQLAVGVALKRRVAAALVEKVHLANRVAASQDKTWYKNLQEFLATH